MEHLVNFLVWMFTLLGVTVIVTQSSLLLPLRTKIFSLNRYIGSLIACGLCFSFWAAIGIALLLDSLTGNLFLDGCLGSGLYWYVTYGVPPMPPTPPMPPMHSHYPPPSAPPIKENIQKDTKEKK